MKKNVCFFILFLLICSTGYCEFDEKYALIRKDGGLSIIVYNHQSKDALQDVLNSLGCGDCQVARLKDSDIPLKRDDRDFWALNDVPIGPKIKIDSVKKQEYLNKISQKKEKKELVLSKLKITEEEFNELMDKEIMISNVE